MVRTRNKKRLRHYRAGDKGEQRTSETEEEMNGPMVDMTRGRNE
jgi:hypothetical protein